MDRQEIIEKKREGCDKKMYYMLGYMDKILSIV